MPHIAAPHTRSCPRSGPSTAFPRLYSLHSLVPGANRAKKLSRRASASAIPVPYRRRPDRARNAIRRPTTDKERISGKKPVKGAVKQAILPIRAQFVLSYENKVFEFGLAAVRAGAAGWGQRPKFRFGQNRSSTSRIQGTNGNGPRLSPRPTSLGSGGRKAPSTPSNVRPSPVSVTIPNRGRS